MIVQKIIQEHTRLLNMEGGGRSEALLTELGNYAVENGLAGEGFTEALLDREKKYPTGIQARTGIAIPHSEQEFTIKPTVIIVLLNRETLFQPMGGGSDVLVKTVFLLLLDKMEHQVEMLGNIAAFIQDEEKMGKLQTREEAGNMILLFEQFFAQEEAG